jgi:hypothetical protein
MAIAVVYGICITIPVLRKLVEINLAARAANDSLLHANSAALPDSAEVHEGGSPLRGPVTPISAQCSDACPCVMHRDR